MNPKRTLSFHGDFWQGFVKLSISHQASAAAVATILTFSPVVVLTWALITHAQGAAKNPDSCEDPVTGKDRRLAHGFTGNSDFYGLGIRLGIYLQWLASLLANPLLTSERASMAGAYLTFSLALAIAVLILAFQRECAFTAEILVVLNIFWGGTLLVMVPFVRLLADIRTTGLGLALIPLILTMLPVSAWFWLRLAFYGEVDFVPTPPGGTTFFLLAPVPPSHLRGLSVFTAIICLILCLVPVFSSICLCLVLFVSWVGGRPAEWSMTEEEKGWGRWLGELPQRLRRRWTKPAKKAKPNKWIIPVTGIIFAAWSILAVELTLLWNSVEDVYDVQSTGQIIALVVGLGILVKVLWILRHGKVEG